MHHKLSNMASDAVPPSDSIVEVPDTISVFFLPQSDISSERVITKCLNYLTHTFISSPELKAQVSFSDHLLSVVCLSVCPDVCLLDLYIFNFFSRTAWPILTKVGTNHS
jgi:hypothetical protein